MADLGLSHRQARIYLTLLNTGYAEAKAIADRTHHISAAKRKKANTA